MTMTRILKGAPVFVGFAVLFYLAQTTFLGVIIGAGVVFAAVLFFCYVFGMMVEDAIKYWRRK